MNPAIEDDAALRRHVRTIITLADNVRRGALPVRALKRIVTPEVADEIVGELPSSPGVSTVNTVHLQRHSPTRTYFTGSVLRPDGGAVAYLGLASRAGPDDAWQVTQVLPVSEHTLGRVADGRIVAAPPDQVAAFRTVISSGYLDASVQLLGPIPQPDGQRRDWAEAAEAVVTYAHRAGLDPHTVATELDTDRAAGSDVERDARTYIDSYRTAYGIDRARYTTFEARLDALRGRDDGHQAGVELEADR